MKNRILSILPIVIITLFISIKSYGQISFKAYEFDTASSYIVKLKDDTQFTSKFLYKKDTATITISTTSIPKLDVPIDKIKSIQKIEPKAIKNGVYWYPNPNPTRYLFGPSAINLKKGEGYYQNIDVFLHSFNVGISDNFSIGGGIETVTLLSGFDNGGPGFFITPKLGYKVGENWHLGTEVLYVGAFGPNSSESNLGVLLGLATYGSIDNNITVGVGYGFYDENSFDDPFFTFSGMARIAKRLSLVTENWIIPTDENNFIISYGLRFFGEKLSVDLGFIHIPSLGGINPFSIPYVDFVVKFN